MISPKVIRALSLPTIDTFEYTSVSESDVETTIHLIKLAFTLTDGQRAEGEVAVGRMEPHPNYDVILGMNVLSHYRLEIHLGNLTLELPVSGL